MLYFTALAYRLLTGKGERWLAGALWKNLAGCCRRGIITDVNSKPRVSPSGKAVASQATIHGFESRHPLYFFNPSADSLINDQALFVRFDEGSFHPNLYLTFIFHLYKMEDIALEQI